MPGPFDQRGVVGEIVAACLRGPAMRVEQRRETRTPAASARCAAPRGRPCRRHGRCHRRVLIVSVTSSAGMAAPVSPQATMARETSSAEQNGRAASCTSTMSGARAAQRLEAGPHRGLPRRPARHRAPAAAVPWRRPRKSPRSSGWMTACTAPIWPCQANSDRLDRITGSPANCRYCLGKSPPARSPRPAATTTAATEGPMPNSDQFANAALALPRSSMRQKDFHRPRLCCIAALALQHVIG